MIASMLRFHTAAALSVAVVLRASLAAAAGIAISQPVDLQVVQRGSGGMAMVSVSGTVTGVPEEGNAIEMRIVSGDTAGGWQQPEIRFQGRSFATAIPMPAGGWHRLESRLIRAGDAVADTAVDRVGVGEVFVVAGQSNSANHGEGRNRPRSDRVVTCAGATWRPAADPQPGASGGGGSFMPALGDMLVEALDVPVGFVACGIGATSVREWLPAGERFPNPPTLEGNVRRLPEGGWESDGRAFNAFVARMKPLGPHGFRAVLWHQGESDANQADATRTLPGPLYRDALEKLIRASRREIGWDAPWFVAQASYHVPGDEGSPEIREAQAAVCRAGIAVAGPDSDALKGDLREAGGKGVHFSAKGLREHAARWAEKILPWLQNDAR